MGKAKTIRAKGTNATVTVEHPVSFYGNVKTPTKPQSFPKVAKRIVHLKMYDSVKDAIAKIMTETEGLTATMNRLLAHTGMTVENMSGDCLPEKKRRMKESHEWALTRDQTMFPADRSFVVKMKDLRDIAKEYEIEIRSGRPPVYDDDCRMAIVDLILKSKNFLEVQRKLAAHNRMKVKDMPGNNECVRIKRHAQAIKWATDRNQTHFPADRPFHVTYPTIKRIAFEYGII